MIWYAVYREIDGELLSLGTTLASPLSQGIKSKVLAQEPNLRVVQWNRVTLDFVPKPDPIADPVQEDVKNLPNIDVTTLTQAQLVILIAKALKFLVKKELSHG
jgi:hypothetical protein